MAKKSIQQSKAKLSLFKTQICNALDIAGTEFASCFSVVASLNNPVKIQANAQFVVSFQIRLFKAIEPLEELYRHIKIEEKRLIQRKRRLNRAWFEKRMAKLSSYSKAIREALTIGRTIGDGFAWFFYQNDRDLIAEHLKHQKQPLLPPGVGRLSPTSLG